MKFTCRKGWGSPTHCSRLSRKNVEILAIVLVTPTLDGLLLPLCLAGSP